MDLLQKVRVGTIISTFSESINSTTHCLDVAVFSMDLRQRKTKIFCAHLASSVTWSGPVFNASFSKI